jgi:hypothetical protein
MWEVTTNENPSSNPSANPSSNPSINPSSDNFNRDKIITIFQVTGNDGNPTTLLDIDNPSSANYPIISVQKIDLITNQISDSIMTDGIIISVHEGIVYSHYVIVIDTNYAFYNDETEYIVSLYGKLNDIENTVVEGPVTSFRIYTVGSNATKIDGEIINFIDGAIDANAKQINGSTIYSSNGLPEVNAVEINSSTITTIESTPEVTLSSEGLDLIPVSEPLDINNLTFRDMISLLYRRFFNKVADTKTGTKKITVYKDNNIDVLTEQTYTESSEESTLNKVDNPS